MPAFMFETARVIRSRRYFHQATGRTASIYGCHPATGSQGNTVNDWTIRTDGWCLECIDSRGVMTIQGMQYPPYRHETPESATRQGLKLARKVIDSQGVVHDGTGF
jgi:hypothetical protein